MLRMLSSAFGDLREKFSQASYRIAEGEVDPGRNTETEDTESQQVKTRKDTGIDDAYSGPFE